MLTKSPYAEKGDPYENIKVLTTTYEMLCRGTMNDKQICLGNPVIVPKSSFKEGLCIQYCYSHLLHHGDSQQHHVISIRGILEHMFQITKETEGARHSLIP